MDEEAIRELESVCDFSREIEEGFCTAISFHDDNNFGCTIRRNPRKFEIIEKVAKFKRLKSFNARKCRLGRLPVFESRDLQYLDISCNDLEEFPDWVLGLPLKFLNVGANKISRIPDLSPMPLETLKLHKNVGLRELPRLGSSIKSLNLFLMPLMRSVPEEVLGLRSLEVFSFGGTRMEILPDFSSLQKLKWLTVTVNNFEHIHESICMLDDLEGLFLAKNTISSVPECIGALKNLKFLTLYGNRISRLPRSFFDLKLKKLNLSRNPLFESDRELVREFGKNMDFFRV